MKKNSFRRGTALMLVFCMVFSFALGCTGCGGGTGGGMGAGASASAASMFLRKTEGTVAVADAGGADVAPEENLGLYSGYTVGTKAESFAWIDLDKVKLAKLDENSTAAITKDGKNLTVDVTAGSMFFNVTEPLADDETMEIRTSSMLVGIRGTCGWVEVPDSGTMRVYILEGRVECTADGNTETVNAGEMAEMKEDGTVTVKAFAVPDVPVFVAQELEADETLSEAVRTASGIDMAGSLQSAYPGAFRGFDSNLFEIVFAEEIDFEADGSPELMVICKYLRPVQFSEEYRFDIYQRGTESSQPLFSISSIRGGENASGDASMSGRISLVESEGRLLVLNYQYSSYDSEEYPYNHYDYYGAIAQNDGDPPSWGLIDSYEDHIYFLTPDPENTTMNYNRIGTGVNGIGERERDDMTLAEYEALLAQYTEVRVLVTAGD